MSNKTCILTTKDFTILEVMRDRCLDREDPLAPILKRKIESSVVVFRDDVPEDVATLNSRVTFTVNGRDPDTRVISHDRMTSPISMYLPVTTLQGLALLGLSEGQEFVMTNIDGAEERITLVRVHYQPEAAARGKAAMKRGTDSQLRKPTMKVIGRAFHDRQPLLPDVPDGFFDDPGQSGASSPHPRWMLSAKTLAAGIGAWFQEAMLMMVAAMIGTGHRRVGAKVSARYSPRSRSHDIGSA